MTKFKVGDRVRCCNADGIWTIEKEYPCKGVFLIGNKKVFCDMVSADELKMVGGKTKGKK